MFGVLPASPVEGHPRLAPGFMFGPRRLPSALVSLSAPGERTRPSTTPVPGCARPRRTSRWPYSPPPVRSRTPALKRRNATFGIAGSSVAWFFSPSQRLRRARSHPSRLPPTGRRFPCDRVRKIRDKSRHRRVDPRPIIPVKRYEPYGYDDVGTSSVSDDPSAVVGIIAPHVRSPHTRA